MGSARRTAELLSCRVILGFFLSCEAGACKILLGIARGSGTLFHPKLMRFMSLHGGNLKGRRVLLSVADAFRPGVDCTTSIAHPLLSFPLL